CSVSRCRFSLRLSASDKMRTAIVCRPWKDLGNAAHTPGQSVRPTLSIVSVQGCRTTPQCTRRNGCHLSVFSVSTRVFHSAHVGTSPLPHLTIASSFAFRSNDVQKNMLIDDHSVNCIVIPEPIQLAFMTLNLLVKGVLKV